MTLSGTRLTEGDWLTGRELLVIMATTSWACHGRRQTRVSSSSLLHNVRLCYQNCRVWLFRLWLYLRLHISSDVQEMSFYFWLSIFLSMEIILQVYYESLLFSGTCLHHRHIILWCNYCRTFQDKSVVSKGFWFDKIFKGVKPEPGWQV